MRFKKVVLTVAGIGGTILTGVLLKNPCQWTQPHGYMYNFNWCVIEEKR